MIAVGCDHAGLDLKAAAVENLQDLGLQVADLGVHTRDSVDYPDIAAAVAAAVVSGRCRLGILICGTGIGVSIAANKVKGIRAALCSEPFSARMAREHNDANILCLGSRIVGVGLAQDVIQAFLSGAFAGERHTRRVEKIRGLESEQK